MPKWAVFERYRRELSLDVSVGVHILLVVEQSSLESQSRGRSKTAMLTVCKRKLVLYKLEKLAHHRQAENILVIDRPAVPREPNAAQIAAGIGQAHPTALVQQI